MNPPAVLHVDPESGFSGGETQVLALASHLAGGGHRTLVACHPGGPLQHRAQAAGLAVAPLPTARSHDPMAGLRLRRLGRTWAADIVHLHTARALSLAPFLSSTGPGVVFTRRMDYPPRGARAYVRWVYGRTDAVIAISAAVGDALALRGVSREAITIVPDGIDVEHFRSVGCAARAAAREGLRLAAGEPVVAIVASLHERKGHAVLLQALARLAARGLRPICLAAGVGPEGDRLVELAARLGLGERVRWLGRLEDVRPVLLAADVVAMPSLAEGLGVAAIEALAAGCPLVASRAGGLAELVRDGIDGLLVPVGDDAALAEALTACIVEPELARRLGAAGALRATGFSSAEMARRTEAVYERVLERRRGAPRAGSTERP